jgi:hypothetical protein
MFKMILLAGVLSGAMAYPALAQMSSDDMSCADFMAMDADAQMAAIHAMTSDNMMGEDAGAGGMMAEGDNMAAGDNMSGDQMASGNMAGDDNMMAGEVTAEALMKACASDPKMMLHDAMMQAEGN